MSTKKILLVDDSCTARLVNRMIFSQKTNYVLISAVDGKEAVERAKREKPDLILMDIVMPRMTGLEACRIIKKDKETEQIPVILLTTRGEEQFVQEGYASGCSDYLTKPVNDAELLSRCPKSPPRSCETLQPAGPESQPASQIKPCKK